MIAKTFAILCFYFVVTSSEKSETKNPFAVEWKLSDPQIQVVDGRISIEMMVNKKVKKVKFFACINAPFEFKKLKAKGNCEKFVLPCHRSTQKCMKQGKLKVKSNDTIYFGLVSYLKKSKNAKKTKKLRYKNVYHHDINKNSETVEKISNPGRGFYKHTETSSSSYSSLTGAELTKYVEDGFSILFRNFVLDTFASEEISEEILVLIANDFDEIRNHKMKVILRFCYTLDDSGSTWYEAPLTILLNHIAQLKPIFKDNADIILVAQAGFVGVWGEWYYTTNYGNPNEGGVTDEDWVERKQIVDALLDALPEKVQVQLRTPLIKQTLTSRTTPLTPKEVHGGTDIARLAHHNDCFLASDTDFGTYVGDDKTDEFNYLKGETKYLAMGGETCNMNPPRSDCAVALQELSDLHFTYLNSGYHPDVLQSWRDQGCYDEISQSLGYRFRKEDVQMPDNATAGEAFNITITLKNVGFSAPLENYVPQIILRDEDLEETLIVDIETDTRFWLPGENVLLDEEIILKSTKTGEYSVLLRLADGNESLKDVPEYRIVVENLADETNPASRDNLLGSISIN